MTNNRSDRSLKVTSGKEIRNSKRNLFIEKNWTGEGILGGGKRIGPWLAGNIDEND